MPLSGSHTDNSSVIHAVDVDQYTSLLTGAMADQPVAVANSVVAQSLAVLPSGPYTSTSAAGTIENIFFLPAPNGADDTANINAVKTAAIAQMVAAPWQGAIIQAQPGIYRTSSSIALATQGLSLRGASGPIATTFRPISTMSSVFSVQAPQVRLSDFLLQPFATQQAATTLAAALNAGTTYTQMTVATVPAGGWATGALVTIGPPGGGTSQTVTLTGGPYVAGGSNVVVTFASTKAYFTYGIGAAVQDLRFSGAVAADGIQLTNGAFGVYLDNLNFLYLNGWAVNYVPTGGQTAFNVYMNALYAQHCANGIHITGSSSTSSVSTNMTNVGMDTMDVGDAFHLDGGAVGCHDVSMSNVWGGGIGNCLRITNDVSTAYVNNFNFGGIPGFLHQGVLVENPAAGVKSRMISLVGGTLEDSLNGFSISDTGGITLADVDIFNSGSHGGIISGGDAVSLDRVTFRFNNQGQFAATADLDVTSTTTNVDVDSPRFLSTQTTAATILPNPNLVAIHGKVQSATTIYGGTQALGIVSANVFSAGPPTYGGGATDLVQLNQALNARTIGILNDASSSADTIAITAPSKTTGHLLNAFHNASAFSGDAQLFNFAVGSGSFTGNFLRMQVNSGDLFLVNAGGKVPVYGGLATAGLGISPIVAAYATTGNVAAVTNAINYTPAAAVGSYRLRIHYRPTATGASTSVGVTVTYKDSTGAISLTTLPFIRRSTATLVAPPFLNTGADDLFADFAFEIDNSATAITVSTTGTFTGTTYNFRADLERVT